MIHVSIPVILAAAWIPLMVRFLRGWRKRRNPVSLAICATISAQVYANVTATLTAAGLAARETVWALTMAVNVFIVINFYLSFRWASQRFPDARRDACSIPPTDVSKQDGD